MSKCFYLNRTRICVVKRMLQAVFCVLFTLGLCAEEPGSSPKPYNLSVCAIFKNEAPFLKEWIEYHRIVGVDHFYLYNNGSTDRLMGVLRPYIREGLVTLIHWPDYLGPQDDDHVFIWALSTQVSAYENAVVYRAPKETEWIVMLEVNEFLVSPKDINLKELLARHKDAPGIRMNSNSYDASAALSTPGRRLLIETTEMTKPIPCHPHKSVSKMIFKPAEYNGFSWYPYEVCFKDEQIPVDLRKAELCVNKYENRFNGKLAFGKPKDKLHVDNRKMTEEEHKQALEQGYEIEDQDRPIYRFIPDVLRKLGHSR